jgi:hypothetical protein
MFEHKLSHPIYKIKEDDYQKAKRLLAKNTKKETVNNLLEFHFVQKNNLNISKFLLDFGADPNIVCKGIGNYHQELVKSSPNIFEPKYLVNEPLAIQVLFNQCIEDDCEDLDKQMELLSNYNVNFDIKTKKGIPLIDLIAARTEPPYREGCHHMDHNLRIEKRSAIVSKTLAILLKNKVDFSLDCYLNYRHAFLKTIEDIGGKHASYFVEKNKNDYFTVKDILSSLVG